MGLSRMPGSRMAKVTTPATAGESYSASENSTSATDTIAWAIRATCMEATTRPRSGMANTARYERSSGRSRRSDEAPDGSVMGPSSLMPDGASCDGTTCGRLPSAA